MEGRLCYKQSRFCRIRRKRRQKQRISRALMTDLKCLEGIEISITKLSIIGN